MHTLDRKKRILIFLSRDKDIKDLLQFGTNIWIDNLSQFFSPNSWFHAISNTLRQTKLYEILCISVCIKQFWIQSMELRRTEVNLSDLLFSRSNQSFSRNIRGKSEKSSILIRRASIKNLLPYLSRNIRKNIRALTLWYSPASFISILDFYIYDGKKDEDREWEKIYLKN